MFWLSEVRTLYLMTWAGTLSDLVLLYITTICSNILGYIIDSQFLVASVSVELKLNPVKINYNV